jgi:hypothetical protein
MYIERARKCNPGNSEGKECMTLVRKGSENAGTARMCCLVTYCHGSPGGYGGNESRFKETRDYLISKFRRGFSSSSQSDFDSTTSGEDANVVHNRSTTDDSAGRWELEGNTRT